MLKDAARHYRDALRASPQAIRYLMERAITGATAARFGLGYARPSWQDLGNVFAGYDGAAIDAAGLVASSGEGETVRRYDRFRDRVMFPIRTLDGTVAGFGGRVIHDGQDAKYLNSPEGPCFRKRELLYGLYEAQHGIKTEGVVAVVEGYVDVVSVAQVGFPSVVGTLGTACSSEQVANLLEFTSNIMFCFDGDQAGKEAAARALMRVLPFASDTRSFSFMLLPDNHDPDSFVRTHGLNGWFTAMASALSLTSFLIDLASEGCNFEHAEGRALCASRARGFYACMPEGSTAKQDLLAYCANVLGFSQDQVLDIWGL